MARSRGYCENPVCGVGPVDLYAGRCRACYQYGYRTGTPRPQETVIRSYSRTVEALNRRDGRS